MKKILLTIALMATAALGTFSLQAQMTNAPAAAAPAAAPAALPAASVEQRMESLEAYISNGDPTAPLKDTNGNVIQINQLWGIEFGDGLGKNGAFNQLYFTAGPDNNLAGLFGVIDSK